MLSYDYIVVGSGPGGGVTAHELAKAGKSVLILEEGDRFTPNEREAFSVKDMAFKYRNAGLTVGLGNPKVAYVEGCVVGGGSEVNSGLYHRTPSEVLDSWARDYDLKGASQSELLPYFQYCEDILSVTKLTTDAPKASLKLFEGAKALGWSALEVPRWIKSEGDEFVRQSISRTFLARALTYGAILKSGTKLLSFESKSEGWQVKTRSRSNTLEFFAAKNLVLACGAIQTPAILRCHGIKNNVGNSLQMHPTIKAIARFQEKINSSQMGVPVHQVSEFWPNLTLGCSISSKSYLAMGLLESNETFHEFLNNWESLGVYYAAIKAEARGRIRTFPGLANPVVFYQLTKNDIKAVFDGLEKLVKLLFAAGAKDLIPSIAGAKPISASSQVAICPANRLQLMTIHLFASCPMGENRALAAANSYGKVFGHKNLYIADASMLCSSLGVNPQGSIMAFAARNANSWINQGDS